MTGRGVVFARRKYTRSLSTSGSENDSYRRASLSQTRTLNLMRWSISRSAVNDGRDPALVMGRICATSSFGDVGSWSSRRRAEAALSNNRG